MKNYFVVSDLHSCFDELIQALNEASYDKNNPDHILIVCGDILDRGSKAIDVINFLKSLPKERRILIRGNHEYMLKDALVDYFDPKLLQGLKYNGTLQTMCDLADMDINKLNIFDYDLSDNDIAAYWHNLVDKVKETHIVDWVFSDEWTNYFETKDYIFVHGYIPLKKLNKWKHYYSCSPNELEFITNWREEASIYEWEGCVWFDPIEMSQKFPIEKTIVCGHVPTKIIYEDFLGDKTKGDCPIYYSNNLIGIDGGAFFTHHVNVFTFEGE